MTVYILDDDTVAQDRRDWPFLTGRQALISIGRNGHTLTTPPDWRELASSTNGVVFIHSSYCPPSELESISKQYPNLILVLLNAGGIPNGPRGSRFWSVQKPVGKSDTDHSFAHAAREFLADHEKRGTPDFQKLEPDTEPLLALRLLCEAWQMTEGQNPNQNPATTNGIQIGGPKEPQDWFGPFAIDVPATASDEAKKKFAQEREGLAKLMSPAESEAKALFDAIVEGKSRKDDLEKFIEAFLRNSKTPSKLAEK